MDSTEAGSSEPVICRPTVVTRPMTEQMSVAAAQPTPPVVSALRCRRFARAGREARGRLSVVPVASAEQRCGSRRRAGRYAPQGSAVRTGALSTCARRSVSDRCDRRAPRSLGNQFRSSSHRHGRSPSADAGPRMDVRRQGSSPRESRTGRRRDGARLRTPECRPRGRPAVMGLRRTYLVLHIAVNGQQPADPHHGTALLAHLRPAAPRSHTPGTASDFFVGLLEHGDVSADSGQLS